MLYWNTVNELLKAHLLILMQAAPFSKFRLVGGTSLSLQLGHRMSVDIDFFTDAPYGSIDFHSIDDYLASTFNYVNTDFGVLAALGKSYLIGAGKEQHIKLDVFYNMDEFIQEPRIEDGIRLASVEDIIAMKVDVVMRGGRKKDFWDLHALLPDYSVKEMIALHKQRSPYTHNEQLIFQNFTNFIEADDDLDPLCLKGNYWDFIKEDLLEAVEDSR